MYYLFNFAIKNIAIHKTDLTSLFIFETIFNDTNIVKALLSKLR